MLITRGGVQIHTPGDWFAHAKPRGGVAHWVPGRSAYELAAAWCAHAGGADIPADVGALLDTHPNLRGLELLFGTPERRLRFDRRAGEPRNADMAITARGAEGAVAITVEAKADEEFDSTVAGVLDAAVRKIARDERTHVVARVQDLASAPLPPHVVGLPHLGDLRYQLLTAVAGTLAFAADLQATSAVLIVQEFVTGLTLDKKHEANARDLDAFIRRLTAGAVTEAPKGQLLGPFVVPGAPLFPCPARFYLGKVSRNLRAG